MNIIILGAPGSGKGTVAQFLAERCGFTHLSTGDMLRKEVKKGSALGKAAEPLMRAGKLVPDKPVAEMVAARLKKQKGKGSANLVLDGFPRNLNQAKILDRLLEKNKLKIDLVLLMDVSEGEIVRRLSGRRQCGKCNKIYGVDMKPKTKGVCDECGGKLFQRADDRREVVRDRLALYEKTGRPVADYYEARGVLRAVDGSGRPEKTFEAAREVMENAGQN